MGKVNTFNPADVVFSINDYVISDFAEGEFIEVVQNSPYFRIVPGIRGKSTRVRNRDRTGVVNFRIMQTSSDNEVLSKIVEQDDVHQTGLLLCTLRDVGGSSIMQFGNAFLEGMPNITYSSQQTSLREWRIHYEFITSYYVTGNDAPMFDFI